MKSAAVLALAALLLVGCGEHKQSAAEKASMDAEFTRIDYAMSNSTLGAPPANEENLERLTLQYVEATRKYGDDLGEREVERRLRTKAEELQPWCLRCVEILDQERKNL